VLLRRIAEALNVSLKELFAPEVHSRRKADDPAIPRTPPQSSPRRCGLRLMRDFSPGKGAPQAYRPNWAAGAGKSTLGSKLAPELRVPFIELDGEIEKQTGMPSGNIFSLWAIRVSSD